MGTPSNATNGAHRFGLLAGNDTYIGGFTFRGVEVARWKGTLGGGAIETPGCIDARCSEPSNTGSADGAAVSNVLIENIAIASKNNKPTVQVNLWMPQTRHGRSNNVTVRNLSSSGSWADGECSSFLYVFFPASRLCCTGINVHGAHTNLVIEDCDIRNSGDDAFAMWSDGALMTNVTFQRNVAYNPTFPWNASHIPPWGANHVSCFSAYGGSGQLKWLNNRCTPAPHGIMRPDSPRQWNDTAVVVFHTSYNGVFGPDAVATVRGNSYSSHTADGLPTRAGFPTCTWATGHRAAPLLAQPHDERCTNSSQVVGE